MDVLQDEFFMLPKKKLGDTPPALNCYATSEVQAAMNKLV
jgi:hypothetical protein